MRSNLNEWFLRKQAGILEAKHSTRSAQALIKGTVSRLDKVNVLGVSSSQGRILKWLNINLHHLMPSKDFSDKNPPNSTKQIKELLQLHSGHEGPERSSLLTCSDLFTRPVLMHYVPKSCLANSKRRCTFTCLTVRNQSHLKDPWLCVSDVITGRPTALKWPNK